MHVGRFFKGPEEILHARDLSLADRMVYFDMAMQAWFKETCNISQQRIADRLGISRRQVQRSQAKLEAERYITAVETGNRTVTTYRLNSRVFVPRKRRWASDMVSHPIRPN